MPIDKKELVLDLLAKYGKIDRSAIKPEHDLIADLGFDSPKTLEFLMEVEEKLDIEVSDEQAARASTVKDVLAFVG